MSNREIAINFFEIKNVKELQNGFYRVTLENKYVRTNDIDIILSFFKDPKVGQKVQIIMESC